MNIFYSNFVLILKIIVLVLLSCFDMCGEDFITLKLKEVDLHNDKVLFDIVNDAVSESKSIKNEIIKYFIVSLNNNGKGTEVSIIGYLNDKLTDYSSDFKGYFLLDNDTILFSGSSNRQLQFKKPNTTLDIKLYSIEKFPGHTDPYEWFYYIIGNCYGRLIPKINWIWHIPKGSSIKSDELILTMPRRLSK